MNREEFETACRRREWRDPFYQAVWERAFSEGVPISGTFELTPRCSFSCPMCYVHLKEKDMRQYGRELSLQEWLRLAREAKEAGTLWVCVTGGEPLLYPEFEAFYRELVHMGFFITVQTNGYLLAGKRFQRLFEAFPPHNMKITLYGSDDAVYSRVCGVKDGFTRVDEGLDFLREQKIPVILTSTIIRENEDDWKKIAEYSLKKGIFPGMTREIFSSARGSGVRAGTVCAGEDEEEEKKRLRRMLKNPFDMSRRPCSYCRDYRVGYWITWEGHMRFCSFMNEPDIQVRNKPFYRAWKELLQYEEELSWPEECRNCRVKEACFKCAGRLAAECGSPHRVTEEFCGRVKKYYDEKEGRWMI